MIKTLHKPEEEEGFTLIELLVVIIIIGVLAAIAIPIFVNQQKASADATTKSDIRNVAAGITTFLAQTSTQLNQLPIVGGYNYVYMANNTDLTGWASVNGGRGEQGVTALRNMLNVSEGTKLGVRLNQTGAEGFCILAGNIGGNYDASQSEPRPDMDKMLFYASDEGSVQTRAELNPDGTCGYYAAG